MIRALLVFVFFATALPAQDTPKALFNGKDLEGWTAVAKPDKDGKAQDGKASWSVSDGILKCTGKPNGYLATKGVYENYVLKVKWLYPETVKAGNSGILLHVQEKDEYWPQSIEAQTKTGFAGDFWLNTPPQTTLEVDAKRHDPMAVRHYLRFPEVKIEDKPLGQWNQYEIHCTAGDIVLWVNGVKANEGKNSNLRKGRIALQSEGSEVWFKDLEIKMIK